VVLVFLCQICSLSSKIAVAQIKAKTKRDWVSGGFHRVAWVPGRPAGSTGFYRVNSQAGFYLHPDRSHARVGRIPGGPAGPVRVFKTLGVWLRDVVIFFKDAIYFKHKPYFTTPLKTIKTCFLLKKITNSKKSKIKNEQRNQLNHNDKSTKPHN
jgi:hypothetical protein